MYGNTTCSDRPEGSWLFCTPPPEEARGGRAGAVGDEEKRCVLKTSNGTQTPAEQTSPTRPVFADCQLITLTESLYSSWKQVGSPRPTSPSVGLLETIQPEPESETSAATCDLYIGTSDWQGLDSFRVSSPVQQHYPPNRSTGNRSGRSSDPPSDTISLQGGSLTSFTKPFRDRPASQLTHHTSGAMSKTHFTSSASSNPCPSTVTLAQTSTRVSSLLGQLTGYSSSEDEVEEPISERTRHPSNLKLGPREVELTQKFKSAEFVDSSSDSATDLRDRHNKLRANRPKTTGSSRRRLPTASTGSSTVTQRQASITSSSNLHHRQVAPRSSSIPLVSTGSPHGPQSHPPRMVQPRGLNTKKRPTSANAATTQAKRPKTRGGFIDNESDNDSDDEIECDTPSHPPAQDEVKAYDDNVDRNQDEDDWDSIPAMPPPPKRMSLDNRTPAPSSAPLPAKGVNMNRLKMLLSKKEERSTFGRVAQPNGIKVAAAIKSTGTSKREPAASRIGSNSSIKVATSDQNATVLRRTPVQKAVLGDKDISSASKKPGATPRADSTQTHPHVLIPLAPASASAGRTGALTGGAQKNKKAEPSQTSSSNTAKSGLPTQAGSHMIASLPLSSKPLGRSGTIAGAPSKTKISSQANVPNATTLGSSQMRQKNPANAAGEDAVKAATGTGASTAGERQIAVRKEKSQNAAGSSAGSGLVGGLLRNIREDDPPTVNAPRRVPPMRSLAIKKSGSDGQPSDNILSTTASLENKNSQPQLVKQPAIARSDLPSPIGGRPGGASSLSFSRTNPQSSIPRSTTRAPDAQTEVENVIATDKSKDSQPHQKRKAEAISGGITENTVPTKKIAMGEDSFPVVQPVSEQHVLSAVNEGTKKPFSVSLSVPLSDTEKTRATRPPAVKPSSTAQSMAPTIRKDASKIIPSSVTRNSSDRPAARELVLKNKSCVGGSNTPPMPAQDASPAVEHEQVPEPSSSARQTAPRATSTSQAVLETTIMPPSPSIAETLVKTQNSAPDNSASRANRKPMGETAEEEHVAANSVSAERTQVSAQVQTGPKALENDMQQESVPGKLSKESGPAATKISPIGGKQTKLQGRSETRLEKPNASTTTSDMSPKPTNAVQHSLTSNTTSVKHPSVSKPGLITSSTGSSPSTAVSTASSSRDTGALSACSSGSLLDANDPGAVHRQAQIETSRSTRKDNELAESTNDESGVTGTPKNDAQPEHMITKPVPVAAAPIRAPLVEKSPLALKPVITAPKKTVVDKNKQQGQPRGLIEKEEASPPSSAKTSHVKEGLRTLEPIDKPMRPVPIAPTSLESPPMPRARPTKPIATPPQITVDERGKQPLTPEENQAEVILLPTSPQPAKDAEPYFEYSVFQKTWSHTQTEHDVASTEIIARPFTCIDDANFQAETLFNTARTQYQQHFQVRFSEFSTSRDDHDCSVHVGVFAPVDYPSRKSRFKIWVRRDFVSALADRTSKSLELTPFVSKTVYVLRLFKILVSAPEAEDDDEDTVMADNDASNIRIYLPTPCAEAYTSLGAANLAARNLQIEHGHEKNPKGLQKTWQASDLASLNEKMSVLAAVVDLEKGDGCWRSTFNGAGKGGDKFELVVEKVALCGPRNL